MTRLFARSQKGSRAYGDCPRGSAEGNRPDGRGKNVTMIGAMSLKGIIAAMTFQGGTNASAFQTYVTQVLVPKVWPGACVVMDNFSSHLCCRYPRSSCCCWGKISLLVSLLS